MKHDTDSEHDDEHKKLDDAVAQAIKEWEGFTDEQHKEFNKNNKLPSEWDVIINAPLHKNKSIFCKLWEKMVAKIRDKQDEIFKTRI